MKLITSKKSMVLYYIGVPGFLVGLIVFYIAFISSQPETSYIGEQQLGLIHISQEAEKYLIFTEQAAKLSADQTMYELANNGGYTKQSPCGIYSDYHLWLSNGRDCYPDYKTEFKIQLNKSINTYLKQLSSSKTIKRTERFSFIPAIPEINYNFFINNTQIIGIADKDIELDMYVGPEVIEAQLIFLKVSSKTVVARNGYYQTKPSFSITPNFKINEFKTIIGDAIELIKDCKDDEDVENCIKENKPDNWNIACKENSIFCFDAKSNQLVLVHKEDKTELTPITYRFALNFS